MKPFCGRSKTRARLGRVSRSEGDVRLSLLQGGIPCRQLHHDVGQEFRLLLMTRGQIEFVRSGRRDRCRNRKRDPASGAGFKRAAHQRIGFFKRSQRCIRIGRHGDAGAIDAIQQVKADVRLACHVQRFIQQATREISLPAVHREFSAALKRERFSGSAADGAVKASALHEVLFGGIEISAKQPRLPAQCHRESMAARRAQPLRFGTERICKLDHVSIRPGSIQEPLRDAQMPIEHPHSELR